MILRATIFLFASMAGFAQTPAFEVASIRPSTNAGNGLNEYDNGHQVIRTAPGSLTIRGASLRLCIQWAFDIPPFQIEGPGWLSEVGIDIVAKASEPVDAEQMRPMLRKLLADRLGLKVHRERKEMQVYELTLAKTGPKFHESTTEGAPLFSSRGKGTLIAERISMHDFAEKLSEPLGRPVMDATGLKGRYDIQLDATAYLAEAGSNGQMDVMGLIFNALDRQLGVKVESRKSSPEMLIVDNMEKSPTEN